MSVIKDPDATRRFTLNWGDWLATGDTIATSTWDVPAGITLVSDDNDDTTATVRLSGGTDGETYTLTNTITTTLGETEDSELVVVVQQDITPVYSDHCWPVDLTCIDDWDDWAIEPDPEADPPEPGVAKYSDDEKAFAVALAGQTMRMLTAYRVGGCPIVVRPCQPGHHWHGWQTYPVRGYAGSTPWFPVNLGGSWLNIGCGHSGSCACSRVSEVRLHGPASAVTEVKIDGAVLDPSAYALRPGGRLVRVDGEGWPLTQNLDAPDTETGTWSVTYRQGPAVDGQGARVAGILAGQYVRACSGGDCDLPKTVTQVVRNGVSVTMTPGAFPNGKTGLRAVDAYLERWNPGGDRGPRMTVWSPDLHRPHPAGPAS